jgi:hypothetical protein
MRLDFWPYLDTFAAYLSRYAAVVWLCVLSGVRRIKTSPWRTVYGWVAVSGWQPAGMRRVVKAGRLVGG